MASSPPLPAATQAQHPQHHSQNHQPSPSEHAQIQKSPPSQALPPTKASIHHHPPHQSPREHASSLPVQPPHSRVSSAQSVKHWEEKHNSPIQRPRETNGVRHSNGPTNGQMYSPSQHQFSSVNGDVVNRLQSQMSLNTASLETQRRDLQRLQENWVHDVQRLDTSIVRLNDDLRGIKAAIDQLSVDVRQRPAHAPPHQPLSDGAVELIRQNLEALRPKVVEIDDVKIQLEILKSRLARFDKGSQEPLHNGHPSYNSPREMPLHNVPGSLHAGPPPRVHTPGRPDGRPEIRPGPGPAPVYHSHHQHDPAHANHHPPNQQQQQQHHQPHPQAHPPQHSQHPRPHPHQPASHGHPLPHPQPHPPSHAPAHTQPHPQSHPQAPHHHQAPQHPHNGLPSSELPRIQDAERSQALTNPSTQPSGWVTVNPSSKRGHTNGVEERAEHQVQPSSPKRPKLAALEPRVDSNEGRTQNGHDRMETDEQPGSRAESRDSYGEPNSAPSQFIAYHSHETPEDWRSDQHRVVSQGHDARTSPKRGRGGGRGRGRKSLPAELGTPQWERTEWSGSQIAPDNYYHESPSGSQHGVFARRDSNGSLVSMPPGHVSLDRLQDPYAHTKKTRTKPIRNADGVLIRKDGRPDMRSQSSAANLRKVHARKEQEKGHEMSLTPTSALAHAAAHMMDTPSPAPTDGGSDHNVYERHSQIMEKVFPHGHDDPLRGHERTFLQQGSPRRRENVKAEVSSSASASPAERMETEAPVPMEAEVEDKTMENPPELPKPQAEMAPRDASPPATNVTTEAPQPADETPQPVVEA